MNFIVRIGCKIVVTTVLDLMSDQKPLVVRLYQAFIKKAEK